MYLKRKANISMTGYKLKDKSQLAVRLTNVTKKYLIHHEKPTLIEKLFKNKIDEFYALQNIDLDIKRGEKIGIIGSNGSGKTTLLKIISGIATPTAGSVKTYGKVISLIDLGAGFHSDMTGIENIFLNGMLLGMKLDEIKTKLDDIINYADIGNFIDAPLYIYSSGMQLRLGFSVAIFSNPDIVVLDEGLNVGDRKFQKKATKSITQLFKKGKTIILASHALDFVAMNCNRIINIKKGKIIHDGGREVINFYKKEQG